ncbi:hypothetical protein [Motilibacter aurantiacus]|uniref:hypothetical protein n=1 Tax=Motilibacter aurantiacus TaxID=2714955 RepID=UPI0014090D06|nr:hypothetical protein [Motilibacter aurantiacus]NHC47010.1 hypothetical protein [Motilibacter aurantiacus]
MTQISPIDANPGAAQVLMLRRVLDSRQDAAAQLLAVLPELPPAVAPQRPGLYL